MIDRIRVKAGGRGEPAPTLTLKDAVAITVGIVVGAGIFRSPSLVAANVSSENAALLIWLAGGLVTLAGALCYAELATAYPHTGGDYHYLTRAYGKPLAFLYAWARIAVVQTGSVALLAFVVGDYASQLFSLGSYSPAIYAAVVVVALTALNVAGVRQGSGAQNWLRLTCGTAVNNTRCAHRGAWSRARFRVADVRRMERSRLRVGRTGKSAA
jgi:amino acid transporter